MSAFLALILLGQTAGDTTTLSDSISDRYSQPQSQSQPLSQAQSAAAIDRSVDESPALPALESPPMSRPTRAMTVADSPSLRPRPSTGFANGAPQRAVQPSLPTVSQETQYATQTLESLLAVDEQGQAKLRKVKLVEIVSQSMDVQSQALAIGAYWDLAMHIGRLRFAQDKVNLLSELPAPNDPAERAVLQAALAAAEVSEAGAQDELLTAQYRLIRTAGIASSEQLPWPSDIPLVGAYRTNFETFFAQRTAPLEIRHIHQSLPGKLRLIERCAVAVSRAGDATDALLQSYKAGRGSLTSLLESTERLERARHAFLTAVVDYNDRIAEYSLAAVGPSVGPETLVTTLIKAPASAANMASVPRDGQGNIAPAGAYQR